MVSTEPSKERRALGAVYSVGAVDGARLGASEGLEVGLEGLELGLRVGLPEGALPQCTPPPHGTASHARGSQS